MVRLRDVPVRWLVAVRSGHAGRGLARVLDHELGPRVTRVDLGGLDDGALSELVLARFGGRWSPGVLRQVVALAAGSPYAALVAMPSSPYEPVVTVSGSTWSASIDRSARVARCPICADITAGEPTTRYRT